MIQRSRWTRTLTLLLAVGLCGVGTAVAQVPKEITNSIGMKLVLIPQGTFTMGSPLEQQGAGIDELPREVTISQDYYLGAFEVTQAQFEQVMGNNPSAFQGEKAVQRIPANKDPQTGRTVEEEKVIAIETGNHPVERISWDDAVEFCQRLSELPEEKAARRVYRLPTEAEWEYACRAGNEDSYGFGNDVELLTDYGWYDGNSGGRPQPVGLKKPNAWGLYDMHGNVWEWCSDWLGEYPQGAVTDPRGPQEGSNRVYRGGSYRGWAENCRAANRSANDPANRNSSSGFRVALRPAGIPQSAEPGIIQ